MSRRWRSETSGRMHHAPSVVPILVDCEVVLMAEGGRFELPVRGYPTMVFKTISLGHSDSPPTCGNTHCRAPTNRVLAMRVSSLCPQDAHLDRFPAATPGGVASFG